MKRGRKPKNSKVVTLTDINATVNSTPVLTIPSVFPTISGSSMLTTTSTVTPSVVLTLRCTRQDLQRAEESMDVVETSMFNETVNFVSNVNEANTTTLQNNNNNNDDDTHINNNNILVYSPTIPDAHLCFWDNCTFTHKPVALLKNTNEEYGCFCCPECAAGYLFAEKIDTSTRMERYHLLNMAYPSASGTSAICPAPAPYYLLKKYNAGGKYSIQEYRSMITDNTRICTLMDAPLVCVTPILHNDANLFLGLGSSLHPNGNNNTNNNNTNGYLGTSLHYFIKGNNNSNSDLKSGMVGGGATQAPQNAFDLLSTVTKLGYRRQAELQQKRNVLHTLHL